MNKILLFILAFVISNIALYSENDNYVEVTAKNGDGITILLKRYALELNRFNYNFFIEYNAGKFVDSDGLKIGTKYFLPIKILPFNGNNIRTSLDIDDYNFAKKIQNYNQLVLKKGLKKKDYIKDKQLWLPLSLNQDTDVISAVSPQTSKNLPKNIIEPLFGEKYKSITIINHSLANCIFYIVSGHGGVDPGAVGYKDGYELHEDEYAYDVSLRLARKLLEYGADVKIIVQDQDDGIRDDRYLKNSYNEYHIGNIPIPKSQNERLVNRTAIINDLFQQNSKSKKKQFCIETHVDSRYTGKKVDIFFYYKKGNNLGKKVANDLKTTIENKYKIAQPGRGYEGSVTSRGLYMLRNVLPTSVFIEIGNIQNPRDQIRIIESNNRQAIANWLCDGIIYSITGKQ